jgi:hypothetical protein
LRCGIGPSTAIPFAAVAHVRGAWVAQVYASIQTGRTTAQQGAQYSMPERHFNGNNNEVRWSHTIIEVEHAPPNMRCARGVRADMVGLGLVRTQKN